MQGLTGFQRDLLFVLAGTGTSNGTQLKRELERERYSSLLSGRLYHNLDKLVERSLVCKRVGDGRENEYYLAESALERLRDHHEWQQRYLESVARPRDSLAP